ncbi:MAG: hypothetical protein SYR96_24120 [Actinomycetota bacterium]|nr:hypothetical protein [Actinomycetota bacterium]
MSHVFDREAPRADRLVVDHFDVVSENAVRTDPVVAQHRPGRSGPAATMTAVIPLLLLALVLFNDIRGGRPLLFNDNQGGRL